MNLALRVLRGITQGLGALLEHINLRDGYRASKRDIRRMRRKETK